jgi:hypothetical protein
VLRVPLRASEIYPREAALGRVVEDDRYESSYANCRDDEYDGTSGDDTGDEDEEDKHIAREIDGTN